MKNLQQLSKLFQILQTKMSMIF